MSKVLSYGLLCTALKMMEPSTWEKINSLLAEVAAKENKISGDYMRLDSTVSETNIHFPTDNGLLWDSYRVISRIIRTINEEELVEKRRQCFGKNIIITDNTDWSIVDIVEANLDRWEIEDRFRLSKNEEFVSVSPLRHWTDSKIRCHLFTCVVALTYLRRIELRLVRAGIRRSAEEIMEDMHNLHSVLFINDGRSTPKRKLEVPTKTQAEVLTAFGYEIDSGEVLQPLVR